jgi:hypothetical protein
MQATDALSLAVELGQVLDAASLPYAIGGALALGVHGVSRATQDVDINVFVEPERLDALFAVLKDSGVQVDVEKEREGAITDGVFFTWFGNTRIDVVFLPSIELSWEALRTRVSIDVMGVPTWFLSPELLCCWVDGSSVARNSGHATAPLTCGGCRSDPTSTWWFRWRCARGSAAPSGTSRQSSLCRSRLERDRSRRSRSA